MPDSLLWPVEGDSRITNPYGAGQYRAPGFKGNLPSSNVGVDIGAKEGSPMLAAAGGTVVEAGWSDAGWGYTVKIRTADGHTVRQSHMKEPPTVKVGDRVTAGQRVGLVGKTGNTDGGAHADIELRDPSGKNIDPTPLFTRSTAMATGTKTNTITTLEKQVETARAAFAAIDERKRRSTLNTNPAVLTDDAKAEDEEWRSGVRVTIKDGKPTEAASPLVKQWQDAKEALEKAERELAKALDDEPKAPPAPTTRQGPDGKEYQWDATQNRWIEAPGFGTKPAPAPKESDPEDDALKTAQAGYYTQLAERERLRAVAEAALEKQRQRFAELYRQADKGDPAARQAAIEEIAQMGAILEKPEALLSYLQNQASQQLTRWKELQDSTGQQHDPVTLQPVIDPATGQPKLTPAAQKQQDLIDQQKRANEIATAREAREGREGVATGLRGLMTLDQSRKKNLADALSSYEQTGIATSGRIGNLESMQSSGLTPETAAAAIGLDPNGAQFQTIWQSFQGLGGLQGLGGQQPQQQQPAAPQPPAPQITPIPNAPVPPPAPIAPVVAGVPPTPEPDAAPAPGAPVAPIATSLPPVTLPPLDLHDRTRAPSAMSAPTTPIARLRQLVEA
ncbi:MAG TPA: peptidoglycan DD-metalloendopeptidase family protein [Rhodothermales bacterium]|nr:peptidoglycan DD-metalloendopeptidase family protein [Rhodothermales bacterium]